MDTPGLPGSFIDDNMTSQQQQRRRHRRSVSVDNQVAPVICHYEVAFQSQNDLGYAGPIAGFALGLFGLIISVGAIIMQWAFPGTGPLRISAPPTRRMITLAPAAPASVPTPVESPESTPSQSTTSFDSQFSGELILPRPGVKRHVTFRDDEKSSNEQGFSRPRMSKATLSPPSTPTPLSRSLSTPASDLIPEADGYAPPLHATGVSEFGERVIWSPRSSFERSASSPGPYSPSGSETVIIDPAATTLLDENNTMSAKYSYQRPSRNPMVGLRQALSRKSRTSSSLGESDLISPLTTDDDSGPQTHNIPYGYPSPSSSTSSELPLTPDSASSTKSFASRTPTCPARPSLRGRVSSKKCAAAVASLLPSSSKTPNVRRPPLRTTYTYTYTAPEYDEESQDEGEAGPSTSPRGRAHRSHSTGGGGWRIASDPLPSFAVAAHPPRSLSRSKPAVIDVETSSPPATTATPKSPSSKNKSRPPVTSPLNRRRSSRPQSMPPPPPPEPDKPPNPIVEVVTIAETNVQPAADNLTMERAGASESEAVSVSVAKQSRLRRAAKRFSLH